MTVVNLAAWAACSLLGLLVVFQIALIAGAPIGRFAWGGAHTVLPNTLRLASVSSIFLYILFGYCILAKAGVVATGLSDSMVGTFMWVLTVYFFIGIGLNAMSRSQPERQLMTPVAAVLAGLFLLVALA